MINLIYPSDKCTSYLFQNGIAFGPFNSIFDFEAEIIDMESHLSAFSQGTGMYGENACEHDKLVGDLEYVPLIAGCLPFSTPQYPKQVKVPVKGYSQLYYTAPGGIVVSGGSTFQYTGSTKTQALNTAAWRDPTTRRWHYTRIQNAAIDPTCINSHVHYEIMSVTPYSGKMYKVSLKVKTTTGLGTNGAATSVNWLQPQTYDTIVAAAVGTGLLETASTAYSYVYEADLSVGGVMGPSSVKQKIDSLIAYWMPGEFPIPDVHYGELAMEAAAQVNANHVNMIAFLRDFRHPLKMIPKLKNLRSLPRDAKAISRLKSLSDDYLTIKYGILPTISDLQMIVEALREVKPYFDKNGFSTFSAGRTVVSQVNLIDYELTQRIKLAIEDSDSEFLRLISLLDTTGFLPTCENIWDLIPYSFVLDWFADIGGLFERLDASTRIARLGIRYVTMSRKTYLSGKLIASAQAPISGPVCWVHYHRWVSDQCPVPPLSLQLNSTSDFSHWLESAALLMQRI